MTTITPKLPCFQASSDPAIETNLHTTVDTASQIEIKLKAHQIKIDEIDRKIMSEVWGIADQFAFLDLLNKYPDAIIKSMSSILTADFVSPLDLHRFVSINPEVTLANLGRILVLNDYQKVTLPAYLQFDPAWTSQNFAHLSRLFQPGVMNIMFGALHESPQRANNCLSSMINQYGSDARSLRSLLSDIPRPSALEYLVAQAHRNSPLHGEHGIYRATNPLLQQISSQGWEPPQPLGAIGGLSRSIHQPSAEFHSALLDRFKQNYGNLPLATFGPEYELYLPGLTSQEGQISELDLPRFGLVEAMFEEPNFIVTGDGSLMAEHDLEMPLEFVFDVLKTPEDMAKLQNTISRLNDMGATTNQLSGVHIHFGMEQWNCRSLGLTKHPHAALLDHQEPGEPSTLQLILAKQITLNLAHAQDIFYQVSRLSNFSKPIGDLPLDATPEALRQFTEGVVKSRNLNELSSAAQDGKTSSDRYYLLNLKPAYEKHQTFELRGFTKNFADSMDVDPNLLLRDIVYLQELLQQSIHDVKQALTAQPKESQATSNQSHPLEQLPLTPNLQIRELTHRYSQDSLMLGIVHALGQRATAQKLNTMQALINKRHLLDDQSLQQLHTLSEKTLMAVKYPIHQHFLEAMSDPSLEWNPEGAHPDIPVLHRTHSLRTMSDWLANHNLALKPV